MTKRNKLYARLIEQQFFHIWATSYIGSSAPDEYRAFIRSQSRKNNCYAMALKAIGG